MLREQRDRVRVIAKAYESDTALALGIMLALQLFGLLAVIQVIRAFI